MARSGSIALKNTRVNPTPQAQEVRDALVSLAGKQESFRRGVNPILQGRRFRQLAERVVDLDRVQPRRVVLQKILRREAWQDKSPVSSSDTRSRRYLRKELAIIVQATLKRMGQEWADGTGDEHSRGDCQTKNR